MSTQLIAASKAGPFRLMWFDAYLKGLDNAVPDEPPVHIFVVIEDGDGRKNADGRQTLYTTTPTTRPM